MAKKVGFGIRNKALLLAVKKGYTIDRDGNVFGVHGKKLSLFMTVYKTYLYFGIYPIKGKQIQIKVHRFQAFKKYGRKIFKNGIVVRHKNGNCKDNSWDNILIGTPKDNQLDRPIEERIKSVMNSALVTRKFTDNQIRNIRTEYSQGISEFALRKKYKCGGGSIYFILKGRTYKHVL